MENKINKPETLIDLQSNSGYPPEPYNQLQ